MIIFLQLILSSQLHAQVDVNRSNFLLKNILPSEYKVKVVSKDQDSEYLFVPRTAANSKNLYIKRAGTLLTDNKDAPEDDFEDSNILVQSYARGGNYTFYVAKKQGEGWEMYRYTDGNQNSKNLTFCKSEEPSFFTRTEMNCVFASERICKKPLLEWPKSDSIGKKNFQSFLAPESEEGFIEYQRFSARQFTALRDQMSNTYDIDNFKVVREVEDAAYAEEGMLGDAKRGIVLAKIKALCGKAWKHLSSGSLPPIGRGSDASSRKRKGTR